MTDWSHIQTFLGWCSLLNMGVLIFTSFFLMLMGEKVAGIHAKLFHLEEKGVRDSYFRYVANYKVMTLVFNVVPYIALRLMS